MKTLSDRLASVSARILYSPTISGCVISVKVNFPVIRFDGGEIHHVPPAVFPDQIRAVTLDELCALSIIQCCYFKTKSAVLHIA